ncbi:unnamed protein product, partial [Rotaria socialis]
MNSTYYDDPTKDHPGPAACQGDELSYYKTNSWPSTDNGCEVTSNYSHGNAFE